jgi:exopolysaccharide biosynthesis polyprenyl glycosylphosphotransferase
MSATPLEARSDSNSLIAADAVSYDDASQHDHTPAGLRHDQPRRRGWFLRRSLVLADALAFLIATIGVGALNSGAHTLSHPPLVFGGLFAWIALAWLYGNYGQDELRMARSTADDVPGLVLLAAATTWAGQLADAALGVKTPPVGKLAVFFLALVVFATAMRAFARMVVRRWVAPTEPTLVVGTGRIARRVVEKLAARPEYGIRVIGFVDDDPLTDHIGDAPYLGQTDEIERLVQEHGVHRVILAFSRAGDSRGVELVRRCNQVGVQVDVVPRLYEVLGSKTQVHELDGLPLISLHSPRLPRSARVVKRMLDICVAVTMLTLLSPLLAFIALRIKLEAPGPVFFRQERIGWRGRRFRIFKFRSMYIDADQRKADFAELNKHDEDGPTMFKIPEDPRITPFGRTLRKWSLDELPQLINVVRGEMSLVGPRPLIIDEDRHIVGHGRRRLDLTPGLTGLWQVMGRSDIPFAEMVTLDYLYVTNWSLWGDLKLLARTLPAVTSGRGSY